MKKIEDQKMDVTNIIKFDINTLAKFVGEEKAAEYLETAYDFMLPEEKCADFISFVAAEKGEANPQFIRTFDQMVKDLSGNGNWPTVNYNQVDGWTTLTYLSAMYPNAWGLSEYFENLDEEASYNLLNQCFSFFSKAAFTEKEFKEDFTARLISTYDTAIGSLKIAKQNALDSMKGIDISERGLDENPTYDVYGYFDSMEKETVRRTMPITMTTAPSDPTKIVVSYQGQPIEQMSMDDFVATYQEQEDGTYAKEEVCNAAKLQEDLQYVDEENQTHVYPKGSYLVDGYVGNQYRIMSLSPEQFSQECSQEKALQPTMKK